jgi:hypothetical protein
MRRLPTAQSALPQKPRWQGGEVFPAQLRNPDLGAVARMYAGSRDFQAAAVHRKAPPGHNPYHPGG